VHPVLQSMTLFGIEQLSANKMFVKEVFFWEIQTYSLLNIISFQFLKLFSSSIGRKPLWNRLRMITQNTCSPDYKNYFSWWLSSCNNTCKGWLEAIIHVQAYQIRCDMTKRILTSAIEYDINQLLWNSEWKCHINQTRLTFSSYMHLDHWRSWYTVTDYCPCNHPTLFPSLHSQRVGDISLLG